MKEHAPTEVNSCELVVLAWSLDEFKLSYSNEHKCDCDECCFMLLLSSTHASLKETPTKWTRYQPEKQ